MREDDETTLDERLRQMPLEVPPPRNLWPAISARIERSRRPRAVWLAAAAAVAGACVAASLTWAVMHARGAAPRLKAEQASVFEEPQDASYLAARATLEVSFRQQLAQLDPKARAHIEASLAVIRQAHEDIRKALASDPASPVLEQLWQSTWRDELDLYDRVVRGTQNTLTRT